MHTNEKQKNKIVQTLSINTHFEKWLPSLEQIYSSYLKFPKFIWISNTGNFNVSVNLLSHEENSLKEAMSLISQSSDKSEIIYNSWWHISRHYSKHWHKTYLWHCFAKSIPCRTISSPILNQTPTLIMHISSELGKTKKNHNQPTTTKKGKSNSATISHVRKLVALSQQYIKVNENLRADQKETWHSMATSKNLWPRMSSYPLSKAC